MIGKPLKLFLNRDFILFLGVILGMIVDLGARWTRPLVLPALGWVMTLSLLGISGAMLKSPRSQRFS